VLLELAQVTSFLITFLGFHLIASIAVIVYYFNKVIPWRQRPPAPKFKKEWVQRVTEERVSAKAECVHLLWCGPFRGILIRE